MRISRLLLGVLVVCAASRATAQTLADVARAEQERRRTAGTAAKVYTNGSLKAEPLPSAPPMPAAPSAGAPLTTAPASTAPASAPGAAPGTTASAPGGAALRPAPAAPGVPDGSSAAALPTNEEGWRARVGSLKEGLARNQVLADALQSRIDALLTDFVNRDDPAQRAVVEANRIKALAELDRVRMGIKDGQKAVADLEEQARRAGVPPGWLR